jgi:hypothetical protein
MELKYRTINMHTHVAGDRVVQRLQQDVLHLQRQVLEVNQKMENLWFAPGMPGAASSQISFASKQRQRSKSI